MKPAHFARALLVAFFAVLGSAACGPEPKVSVVCQVVNAAVNCTATEVQGNASLKTCWDVKINCKSGSATAANACESVTAAKPSVHVLNESEFKDIKTCQVTSLNVENIKITKN